MNRLIKAAAIGFSALLPAIGFADSISPATYSDTLGIGESVTITKTVTVTNAPPSDAKVDVFFLADTTGSMGGAISAVKSSASTILSSTAGLGDVAFGVGEYKDFGDIYTYKLNTGMTSSQATAQSAINTWGASGGGDWPEANLYALNRVATDAATGWRTGSTRILVWFGDAPGHDPSGGVNEAAATSALQSMNIVVEAVDVGSMNYYGQASRIAAATGGDYYSGISSGTIVSTIQAAIKSVIDTYSKVCLDASAAPAGVSVVTDPCYTGSFDRSVDRTFTFDVTFTGDAAGTYAFPINAMVDGGVVAVENDRITVGGTSVPEPGMLSLLGLGLVSMAVTRRRRAA